MNKIHIAIVHDQIIPALKYGGTERIIWWLTKALQKKGHQVTLIVPKKSTCPFAKVVARPSSKHLISDLIPADTDIIHSFATLHEKLPKPLMVTIEGNGQAGEKFHPNTVFVSQDHAKRHGSNIFVHNGLDPEDYPLMDINQKEPFSYFLAKAKWKVKNIQGAIEIAKQAKLPIKIMGGYKFSFSKKIKWLGMLGGEEKNKILAKGSALLFPVRWNEPFGIAIIEALLTGSPVFGTPYGSLPELVKEEYGFLSKSKQELANALMNYTQYNKDECRKYVLQHFTHEIMAEKYLNFYEHILKGKTLNPNEPQTLSNTVAETLLEFV